MYNCKLAQKESQMDQREQLVANKTMQSCELMLKSITRLQSLLTCGEPLHFYHEGEIPSTKFATAKILERQTTGPSNTSPTGNSIVPFQSSRWVFLLLQN